MAATQKRLAGLPRATYCNAAKSAVNDWLSQLVAAQPNGGHDAFWCLLLETRELQTLRSLLSASGEFVSAARTVVPNPSAEECAAIRDAAPGVHAIPFTSHAFLADISSKGSSHLDEEPSFSVFRDQWERRQFGFVWLDYCGTLASGPGHRRHQQRRVRFPALEITKRMVEQTDISLLFSAKLLQPSAILAVTLSERGAARLYRGELADSLVICVQAAAKVISLGLAEYRSPTPMLTAAFVVDHLGADLPSFLSREGVSFHHWRSGCGLAECLELPLAKALRLAASAFADAAMGSQHALVLESVKLLPVTRSLEASGSCSSILSSLPDALEAQVAQVLLARSVDVLSGAKLLDYLQQLSSDSSKRFDAVWLGYDGGRAMTSSQLHSCSEWSHLNTLLSLKLLSPTALLAATCPDQVCVAYVSTAEVWVDSAIDWTFHGLNKACQRHGYGISASSVIKFTANNSRFALLVRLGNSEPVAKAVGPALGDLQSDQVEYFSVWNPHRPKFPSGEARRLKRLAPVLTLVREQTLLHEPGFLVLRPMLKQVICCSCDDPVVQDELQRQGLQAVESTVVDAAILQSCRTLALLEDCGPVIWSQRWKDLVMRWMEQHQENLLLNQAILLLLMEASQLEAFQQLCQELKGSGGCKLTMFSFIHGARRWGFALLSAHSVTLPALKLQKMCFLEESQSATRQT